VTLFGLLLGIGLGAPVLALVILAIPSLLAGAYSGCESVPRSVIDAARAQGMSEWQILWRVEVPLGAPLLVNGIRSATLQVVATAMLAAYIGSGGLGRYIFLGLAIKDYPQMLAGSLLVIALAILLEGIGLLVGRAVRPQKFSTEGAPS
jgi:osmoprotectant transport system permease protein